MITIQIQYHVALQRLMRGLIPTGIVVSIVREDFFFLYELYSTLLHLTPLRLDLIHTRLDIIHNSINSAFPTVESCYFLCETL